MEKWRIHWALHESDTSVVDADTEDDARKIFAKIALTELIGTDQNFAEILQIERVERLKPCRKCGSDKVSIESTVAGFTLLYYVRCHECNHFGSFESNVYYAEEAWNRSADDG